MTSAWNMSGTISTSPPMLMTTAISTAMRPMFFSMTEWFISLSLSCGDGQRDLHRDALARRSPGLPHVPGHDEHAAQDEQAARETRHVERIRLRERLDEGVGQRAVRIRRTPHEALRDAGDPHRSDVDYDADRGDPEMQIDRARGVHALQSEQARDHAIQRTDADESDPAERAGVHVADRPIGVVR